MTRPAGDAPDPADDGKATAKARTRSALRGRPRTILHVDMDAFYAAIEEREDPSLAGRPVIIGSDPRKGSGRGVVSTANYEARRYGVHSAQPISVAWRRCPGGVYLRPRISLYAEISRRIFEILRAYTDLVEPLSLDEAFLDVTASRALFGDGPEIARRIKREIRTRERLTASVGVATSKYVAKVASDLEKPDGLVVVPPGSEREFLAPLDVSRLWGAGPRTQEKLRRLGARTIGDLAAMDREALEARLGREMGGRFHDLANGIDPRRVNPNAGRKSLGKEVTFGEDVADREEVERTLLRLCESVARGLRKRGLAGRTVHLKLRWDGFETHTRQRALAEPVATTERIWPVARELFRELDDPRRRVRLIGVTLSGFGGGGARQLGLFGGDEDGADGADAADLRVAGAIDRLTERFGREAVTRAALLGDETRVAGGARAATSRASGKPPGAGSDGPRGRRP